MMPPPFDHQTQGTAFMCEHAQGCANFSEMGAGKTRMAIDAAIKCPDVQRILVVCPNTLKQVWFDEFDKWAPDRTWRFALNGSKRKRQLALQATAVGLEDSRPVVVICNYEMVTALAKDLQAFAPDLIIADEAHYIKSHKAKRTRSLKSIKCKRRWALTGTPTPHLPFDIWSIFDWMQPGHLNHNYYAFRSRYADIYMGAGFPKVNGYQNLDELQRRTKELAFRVTKDECLDLPPKVFQTIPVALSPTNRKRYDALARHFIAEIDDTETISAQNAMVKVLKLQQITSGVAKLDEQSTWTAIGTEKVDAALELLQSMPGERFVIWCRFRAEVAQYVVAIKKATKRPVYTLTGQVSPDERARFIDAFQNQRVDGEAPVIISNVACGGVGITLTAARYVIYASRTFSYGESLQSEDRTHRIGQTSKVTYYNLMCDKTVDWAIWKNTQAKADLADQITGDSLKRMMRGEA